MCICPSACARPSIHFSICTQCTYINNCCTPSGSKPSKNLNISQDCSQNCHLWAKSRSLLLVEYKLCIRNLHCRWGICSKNGRRNVVFISCMYCLFLNINILFHLIEALKLRFKSDNLKIYILENTVFINFCFTNHSLLME